jgi:PKD repeat protein
LRRVKSNGSRRRDFKIAVFHGFQQTARRLRAVALEGRLGSWFASQLLTFSPMKNSQGFAGRTFQLGWLFIVLCVAGVSVAPAARARTLTLSFELYHQQYSVLNPDYQGAAYYTVGVLLASDATPLTIDEVDSPDGSFVGTETGSGESLFADLGSILDAITNGTWTLIVNKGAPSQQEYSFTVAASGLTTNNFSTSQILVPADGNQAVPANTPFFWSSPASWNTVEVSVHNLDYSFYDGASFTAATSEWAGSPILPPGTNEFEVACTTNGAAWFTISTPVNEQAQIFSNWVSGSSLAVYTQSGFMVTTNATNAPVTLGEALNVPTLAWTTSGDALWFGETTNSEDGVAAAQSGVVAAGQSSTLQTTVTVSGGSSDVFFWWQIQDEDDDFDLDFYIDGVWMDGLNGGQAWSQDGPFTLAPGVHTLAWVASADTSGSDSPVNDAGWVDEVSVLSVPTLLVSDSPVFGSVPLTVQFTSPLSDNGGNAVTSWAWDFGDGAVSYNQNPAHTYTSAGTFSPSLEVETAGLATPLVTGLNPVTVAAQTPGGVAANLPGAMGDFTYNHFSDLKSLQLLGNATGVTTGDGAVLQLTASAVGQAGAAWSADPIALTPGGGFSTCFLFRLSKPGGGVDVDGVQGGDGIAFLVQSPGYELGANGGGIGYLGITNSLAVEFDTWDDGTEFGVPGDTNGNHVAVNFNGVLNDSVSVPVTDAMNNGQVWYAWIDYDGVSQDLEVRLSETPVRPLTNVLATTVNLPLILGGTNAYVGFTAATGAAYNEQDILAWKFMALPTTRVTGTLALTNLPAGFQIEAGVVLEQYKYSLAGLTFTNFTCAPMSITPNANGQFAFATGLGNFGPDVLDLAVNDQTAAMAGAGAELNSFAMLAIYTNSSSAAEGALLGSDNNGTGYPGFLQNASFDALYPLAESNYVSLLNQVVAAPPTGWLPPANLTLLAAAGATDAGASAPLLAPMDADGNWNGWATTFSSGWQAGTLTARQQVVYSAPLPLTTLSPRTSGTNFVFDFVAVSNQCYSVWSSPSLTTTNWVNYTNLTGDGYVQRISACITNRTQNFFRLSSP